MIHVLERFSWREWTRMLSESNFSCGICRSFTCINSEEFYPVTGCGSEFFPEGRTANGAPLYRDPDWIRSAIHSICWSPRTVKSECHLLHSPTHGMLRYFECGCFFSTLFLGYFCHSQKRKASETLIAWDDLFWIGFICFCSLPCESSNDGDG